MDKNIYREIDLLVDAMSQASSPTELMMKLYGAFTRVFKAGVEYAKEDALADKAFQKAFRED